MFLSGKDFLCYTDDMNNYDNDFSYFENRDCIYYPCHADEHINCLFCYCPLYHDPDCPGDFTLIIRDGKTIKNCTDCLFPHRKDNYAKIIKRLKD